MAKIKRTDHAIYHHSSAENVEKLETLINCWWYNYFEKQSGNFLKSET